METKACQTEICSRCGKEKHWTDIYELTNYENVCDKCMTEEEKAKYSVPTRLS